MKLPLKSIFKTDVIEFFCHPDHAGTIPEPVSAAKKIPKWWKSLSDTIPGDRDMYGAPSMTAKKCMPLLDVMSLGYIIPLAGDVQIISNNDKTVIKATSSESIRLVEFHNINQIGGKCAPGYPAQPVKFLNKWVIKTAPGWSTLFVPPINHMNPNFTCLGGLVDTDKYPKEVNFPAVWHAANFDDKLPAGTPLVQAIPIKRGSFPNHPVVREMTRKEFEEIDRISKTQNHRSGYYTQELRAPKK